MAQMPIEIVEIGNLPSAAIDDAISIANAVQKEFLYLRLPPADQQLFAPYAYQQTHAQNLMDTLQEVRATLRGYHPYLLALIDAQLADGKYTNIFGSNRPEAGVGVLTIANVPDLIIPSDKISAY